MRLHMSKFSIFLCMTISICTNFCLSCTRLGITPQDSIQTVEEKASQEVSRDLDTLLDPQSPKKPKAPQVKPKPPVSNPKVPPSIKA